MTYRLDKYFKREFPDLDVWLCFVSLSKNNMDFVLELIGGKRNEKSL